MTGPHPDPLPQAGEGEFAEFARRAWHVAASLLGWRPDDFWAATPCELAGALAPPDEQAAPPGRDTIKALMMRFPDHED